MAQDLDMNKLREEAARRAREMQARAHIPQPRKQQVDPPSQPKQAPQPQNQVQMQPAQEEGSLLNAFFKDKERTIILALLLLLSGDEKKQRAAVCPDVFAALGTNRPNITVYRTWPLPRMRNL